MPDAADHVAPSIEVARRRAIVACAVGNFLELFDFAIYGFFAIAIGATFFPTHDPVVSLLSSFATYGVGFIMRPVGALVIGQYGDRHGRKRALIVTVALMACATGLTGLLPSYAEIGLASPLLLVLCRLAQGFSTGGEWGGAASFLTEYAPAGRRGLYGSWQQFSVGIGSLSGSLCAFVLASAVSPAALLSWGWRIPFLLGFLLAPIGYYLRQRVAETPAFERTEAAHALDPHPIRAAFTTRRGPVARTFGVTIIWTVASYIFFTYSVSYATRVLHLPFSLALASNSLALVLHAALVPLMGALSDRIGRKPLMLVMSVGFLVLSYPLFLLLTTHPSFASLLLAQLVAAAMMACFSGPGPAALCEMFPTAVRYTAMSIGYNLAVMIFGGFAPFIGTALVAVTGLPIAPVFYVLAAALVSTVALAGMRERSRLPLD